MVGDDREDYPMIDKYIRAIAVVAVTVATFAVTLITDGITANEAILITGVGVSAIGTAIVPNLNTGIAVIAKTLVTFLLAGLAVLAAAVLNGLTTTEIIESILAGCVAIGVTALPTTWPPAQLPPPASR
ncbi:MAG TPA: hypothetical protein VJ769_09505 [Actinomycetes bacterium]|nr:hypothetical protein [Actinomycetes bacterium]